MPIALDLTHEPDKRRAARIRLWVASMSTRMKVRLQQIAGEAEAGAIRPQDDAARTLYRRGFVHITQAGTRKWVVVTPLGEAALAWYNLKPISLSAESRLASSEALRAQTIARELGGRSAATLKAMAKGRAYRAHGMVTRALMRNDLIDDRLQLTARGFAVAAFL